MQDVAKGFKEVQDSSSKLMGTFKNEVREAAGSISDKGKDLGKVVAQNASKLGDGAVESASELARESRKALSTLRATMRRNPMGLGIALIGVGLLLGAVWRGFSSAKPMEAQ